MNERLRQAAGSRRQVAVCVRARARGAAASEGCGSGREVCKSRSGASLEWQAAGYQH